ncbi:efflux RND transporter periplasmic adaptor subunit [Frigidibacter sp. ROC022]|uniref:efflux RND transporter periplasmic adaptor subunit n=1 Tax=Frigidibacter sp. ROC022 TaxID=2971796 RepID=UPI00215A79FF|nr:efflux RND transporter periplasmic adaptor subunit [Frigidibacter sp. ROC022]MCR8724987.1 efflux RND transporter periplasmic adaptor subunit [Frigidibacter sp. ROC022]
MRHVARSLMPGAVALLALGQGPATAQEPLGVEIVTAHATPDIRNYSLTGELQPRETLPVAFPASGRIAEVRVEVGDQVAAGDLLARMESVQQEQAVRAAEAGLLTAEADHRQAVADLSRSEALLERGATTRAARDAADDALRVAEGTLARAQAELDQARKALADTELLAPAAAIVTQRNAEPGQVVGAAQPLFELALDTGIEAIFDVPEVLLTGDIPIGTVMLSRLDDPQVQFAGTVERISPLVDPATGTVAVTIYIPDPPEGLNFGEAVRGTASLVASDRITLPYTTISATAAGPAVWQVDPETMRVRLTPIQIERYENGRIVLSGGLEEGALVVARGAQLMYPDRQVRKVEVTE